MEGIFETVKNIISDQFGLDSDIITKEMRIEDLSADSLDLVEMVMALEEEFNIEVADEDIEGFDTVSDIVAYINDRV